MQNKGNVKKMWKEAAILFAITLFAGIALGFVHELTKEPIAAAKEQKMQNACRAVLTDASRFEEGSLLAYAKTLGAEDKWTGICNAAAEAGVKIGDTYYTAYDDGQNCKGYVLQITSTQGYGGNIELMIGIAADGTVSGTSILSISETPGLGMRAEEVLLPQFAGQKADAFVYTKSGKSAPNEIDAISGATITTKAVTGAVNTGLSVYRELFGYGWGE